MKRIMSMVLFLIWVNILSACYEIKWKEEEIPWDGVENFEYWCVDEYAPEKWGVRLIHNGEEYFIPWAKIIYIKKQEYKKHPRCKCGD